MEWNCWESERIENMAENHDADERKEHHKQHMELVELLLHAHFVGKKNDGQHARERGHHIPRYRSTAELDIRKHKNPFLKQNRHKLPYACRFNSQLIS